jgi:sterol desaturase/sphingolipid hydroxylase (fatty acid hydroxylase superfamily)
MFSDWINYIFVYCGLTPMKAKFLDEIIYVPFLIPFLLLELGLRFRNRSLLGLIRSRTFVWDAVSAFFFIFGLRRILSNLFLFGGVAFLIEYVGYLQFPLAVGLPIWLRFVLAVLLYDFLSYWSHRWKHKLPLLWLSHEFHHSGERLNLLTSYRVHPTDFVYSALIVYFPVQIFFSSISETFLFGFAVSFLGYLGHARLDFGWGWLGRWVFVSPRYHHLHHSTVLQEQHGNFGEILVIWDRLFGTYLGSEKSLAEIEVGLTQNSYNQGSWIKEMVLPVVAQYQFLLRGVGDLVRRVDRLSALVAPVRATRKK